VVAPTASAIVRTVSAAGVTATGLSPAPTTVMVIVCVAVSPAASVITTLNVSTAVSPSSSRTMAGLAV
jgi:hypothetical protein